MDTNNSYTSLILLTVALNIVSSLFFLFLVLLLFRPRLKIAKNISVEDDGTGKKTYRLKIVNNSFYPAFDLTFSLDLRKIEMSSGNDYDEYLVPLKIKRSFFSSVPSKIVRDKSNTSPYALQIEANEDLSLILANSKTDTLVFQVTLRHGLTGLSRSYEVCYHKKNLKEGSFLAGKKLDIN